MKGIVTKRSTAFIIFLFFLAPFPVWRRYFYCYCLYPFLLVLCPLMLMAQNDDEPFPFRHIEYLGAKQGLRGSEVDWIKQDSRGFMWVITDVALHRYDGFNFQSWSYDAKDTNSISQDYYGGLIEDTLGTLWFPGWLSGAYSFDPVYQKFTHYKYHPGNINSFADNNAYSIVDDGDCIWVQTNTRLSRVNVLHKSFTHYNIPDDEWVWDIAIDNGSVSSTNKRDLYLIGTNNEKPCISYFNTATGKITDHFYFPFQETVSHLFPGTIWRLNQQHKETIWLGSTDDGIYGFNTATHKFLKIPILHQCKSDWHNEGLYSVLEDHDGNLWTVNDNNEVVYYHKAGNKFYFLPYRRKHASPGTVPFLYEDNSHQIWITKADEIMTIDTNPKNILSLEHEPSDPYSIAGNYVCGLNRVNDEFFVATSLRYQVLDRKSNHFYEPAFLKKIKTYGTFFIAQDSKSNVWFIGFHGLIKYNPSTKKVVQYRELKADSGVINLEWGGNASFLEDKKGRYWTSNGHYGLCRIDPKTFHVKTFSFDGAGVFGPIFIDRRGIMYVEGWESSFITFNTNTEQFKIYKHDPSDPASIRQGWAKCFTQTNNGLIWFCSLGGGVGVFDPNTEKFKAFTSDAGLIDDNVVSMVRDLKGRFWAGTYAGLSCFTPPDDPFAENCQIKFRNYDVNDGLPSNAFNWASSFCDTDGTLFFGTRSAGLVYFHPDSLKDNSFIPPVYITGFSLLNKPVTVKDSDSVLKQSIEFTRQLVFNYSQNTFSFSFAALNYTHPEKNRYAYKLEPLDRDWIYTDASHRIATYTNLDPGKYTFKVKGSNNDGVWNETPTELMITIVPPFWQTWWFRTLIFITVAFMLYGIYRYRVQQVVRLQAIRNNIASDLHDDIGSTLNSISIYSEIAKQQAQKEIPALDVIGQNSRKIIESMSDIVWTINPANDPFEKVIARMRSFAYELLKAKKIEFTFEAEEKLNSVSLPMQVRRNFYLIFKEAITNLVKYSGASRVIISMYGPNKNIVLEIRDNGKGIPLNHETQGNGLMNMKRRAEEIQASLNITSGNGSGTSIELMLKT